MDWYLVCCAPKMAFRITSFPFTVGRSPVGASSAKFEDPSMSRAQFTLQKIVGQVVYVNEAKDNPGTLDGTVVHGQKRLSGGVHLIEVGSTTIGVGTDLGALNVTVAEHTVEYYMARAGGRELGPWTDEELLNACENGILGRDSKVWLVSDPANVCPASEFVDFGPEPSPDADETSERRFVTVDEGAKVVRGENFKCPYCRTVVDIGDELSVSVSPSLMGDVVLGAAEQSRFVPVKFNDAGIAIDAEGGLCPDKACPRCHMSLPQDLLQMDQIVMSVVGASSSGKSVYLASCIWSCQQQLRPDFGVGFHDLAPAWNTWIRSYVEKLFFQQDDTQFQQIEKTDIAAANISRSVNLGGESVLLPTPSYFSVDDGRSSADDRCLVVYDCSGEHFKPGMDTHSSLVTMHTLSADTLLFLYDPSADPRMRPLLDRGTGTASNFAQMQDVLLSELRARARKNMGIYKKNKLQQPLIFAISKSDMLRHVMPFDVSPYATLPSGRKVLDVAALRMISERTESFLNRYAPEVAATARDISDNVWFMPVSALGHNPMKEGVRPCDIHSVWTELPVVFTLATKGMIPTVNGKIA